MKLPGTQRTLTRVQEFVVTQQVIAFTEGFLQEVGRRGFEGLVLWGARHLAGDVDVVEFVHAVAPRQQAIHGEEGVGVLVDGEELFRVNSDFYGRRLLLAAQVHSHPGTAYHSETDDAYAVVTIPGGLSLVVPEFARAGVLLEAAAVHRLHADGHWDAVVPREALRLLRIVKDETSAAADYRGAR